MDTARIQQDQISPLDALWALFKHQPKAVRKAFVRKLMEEETTEGLKEYLARHIKAIRSGEEEVHCFDSWSDAKKWLDE